MFALQRSSVNAADRPRGRPPCQRLVRLPGDSAALRVISAAGAAHPIRVSPPPGRTAAHLPREVTNTVANPDNREDNVPKLQRMISNTIRNMREAEDYLDEHADEIGDEERSRIEAKNERRRESLENLRAEIRDEANHQRRCDG